MQRNECNCIYSSEIFCLPVQTVDGGEASGQNSSYASLITYTCTVPGQRFDDGYTVKTVRCEYSAEWNETLSNCAGLYKYILRLNLTFCFQVNRFVN